MGIAIFVVSLAFLGDFYDRYSLGFVPFVILFLVRASSTWGRIAWTYSVVALVLLGSFTLLLKADFVDHDIARWQAAAWLQARAPVTIQVGFDWNGWYGFSGQQNEVADMPIEGYRVEKAFPYFSRLDGFTTHYVLAQSRADLQPLREPTPIQK